MKSARDFQTVYIHRDPVDMRKSINGLTQLVESANMGELSESNVFVFCGKNRKTMKVLYFDRSGYALWYKRLEESQFPWPRRHEDLIVSLSPEQFDWLLDGYDVWKIKPFETLKYTRFY